MVDKKQLQNLKYFNYLSNMIRYFARYILQIEIQDRHGKSSIQQEEDFFHQQIGLKLKEETCEVLHLEHGTLWRCNLDTSESRSETPGKFLNVVLEKDGEDRLDTQCEK